MTHSIEFYVPGRPRAKGSTRSFKHSKTGNVVTLGMSTSTRSWQARVTEFAANQWPGPPARSAFQLTFFALLERPRCHYGTGKNSAKLRTDSPRWPTARLYGDIDKLERAVLDGLTGVVWCDDSQVCSVRKVKRWAGVGETPGMKITVWEMES